MGLNPFKSIGHVFEKAGEKVASTVKSTATTVSQTTSAAAQSAGHFVSNTFSDAVKDAGQEFDNAKNEIQSVVNAGQEAILKSLAGKKIQEYAGIIESLVQAWPRVVSSLGSEVDVLRNAASQKSMNLQVAEAMKHIATSPELRETLSEAANKSIASFAVEFGGNVADVLSVDGAIGFAAGLPNITNVKGYGSVGLSLGASAGASGDLALGLNTSSPEDSGGPFIAFILEGDLDIGGGIVVSFNLPDLSFGGFTIPVSAGEEVNLSVGGGYTFIFN